LLLLLLLLLLCISLTNHANDSHRPEVYYDCLSGHTTDQAARHAEAAAAAAYCTSSECSKKQWPAATCSTAQLHKSNSLQQVSVYHTVHPSAQATFTGMTPAMQQ